MSAKDIATTPGWQEKDSENEKVTLASLSELTGFPVDFIKKELLIDHEPVSLSELRKSMMAYLEATDKEMNQKSY